MHVPSMLIVACIVVASASSLTLPQANNNPVRCAVASTGVAAAARHPECTSKELMEDDQDQREPRRETITWAGIFTQTHAIPSRTKTLDSWKMDETIKKLFDHESLLFFSVENNHPIITADGNCSMLSAACCSDKMLLRQPMVAAILTIVP